MSIKQTAVQLARRTAKGVAASVLHYSGARSLIAAAQRRAVGGRRVLILSYHRPVADLSAEEGRTVPTMTVSVKTLRRHLELLSESYDLVSLDAALDALEGRVIPRRDLAVITFDDGYRGVYLHAFPILKELGVPAVVYVPSGYVGTARRLLHDRLWDALARMEARGLPPNAVGLKPPHLDWLRDAVEGAPGVDGALERLISEHASVRLNELADALEERLGLRGGRVLEGHLCMTWEMLRELHAHGVTVGAHTTDHSVLTHEPLEHAARDLARCKEELESGLGSRVRHFAYCNGWYSPGLAQALMKLGFRSAVTTEDLPNLPGIDPFALKRKVLWENSSAGPLGTYSRALTACQLDDVFGVLSLQTPVLGARPTNFGDESSKGSAADDTRLSG
jgi:peptidoglycan/xylan/chitin deacetylase (PgdA/CDA1 family)